MSKSPLLRVATAVSLFIWAVAIVLAVFAWSLPDFHSRPETGCYTTNAMISYVECRNTGYDEFFGTAMTLAMYWVAGAFVWLGLGVMGLGAGHLGGFLYLGLIAFWIFTVVSIIHPTFSFLRRRLRERESNQ